MGLMGLGLAGLRWGGRGAQAAIVANDLGAFDPGPGRGAGAPHPAALWEDENLPPGEVSFARPLQYQPMSSYGERGMMGRGMMQVITDDIPMSYKPVGRLYENLISKAPDKIGRLTGIQEGLRHLVGGSAQSKSAHTFKDFFAPTKGKHYRLPGGSFIRRGAGQKAANFLPRALLGATKQAGFIPFNALIELGDLGGISPQWAGGTGMAYWPTWLGGDGEYRPENFMKWDSQRDYDKQIFTDPENPTIMGVRDPTPGALLDRAGGVINFATKPLRAWDTLTWQLPKDLVDINTYNREEAGRRYRAAEREKFNEQYPGVEEAWDNRPLDPDIYTTENVSPPTFSDIITAQEVQYNHTFPSRHNRESRGADEIKWLWK